MALKAYIKLEDLNYDKIWVTGWGTNLLNFIKSLNYLRIKTKSKFFEGFHELALLTKTWYTNSITIALHELSSKSLEFEGIILCRVVGHPDVHVYV